MRNVTLTLIALLFLPRGPSTNYSAAARQARVKDFAMCGVYASGVFLLAQDGVVVFAVWLFTTLLFAFYQYIYVFAYPVQRPVFYEEMSLIGLILVVTNHIVVATLCKIGWLGIGLQAFCAFYLARAVGRFAVAREIKRMATCVRQEHPEETLEKQAQIVDWMLRNRVEEVHIF